MDGHSWRKEIASRVLQHKARRRGSARREAAMEFEFPPAEALAVTEEPVVRYRLKRNRELDAQNEQALEIVPTEHKIIRFPRTFAAAEKSPYIEPTQPATTVQPPLENASDSMPDLSSEPRIFEVAENTPESEPARAEPVRAEQLDLLPSFDDIRLEPVHVTAVTPQEIIPNPASLQQRSIAAIVDVSSVATAALLFDFIFVRLAEDDPHSRMALLCGLGVMAILWILFQYLFLVHGNGTPGMLLADLELATFDGKAVPVNGRRCRALATVLSAFSLGFGYAWALIDEDQLGWHDRITGTMLRSTNRDSIEKPDIWD